MVANDTMIFVVVCCISFFSSNIRSHHLCKQYSFSCFFSKSQLAVKPFGFPVLHFGFSETVESELLVEAHQLLLAQQVHAFKSALAQLFQIALKRRSSQSSSSLLGSHHHAVHANVSAKQKKKKKSLNFASFFFVCTFRFRRVGPWFRQSDFPTPKSS
jgi:hypothetical protein